MGKFRIRKRIKNSLMKLFKKPSAEQAVEKEEVKLQTGLSAYEKLANWCREQRCEPGDSTNLSELFIRTTIKKAKEEMLDAGWPEDKINVLPISSIHSIVSQYQTNVLNSLEIDGNALIGNRGALTYDEIVFTELKIARDEADEQLSEWWHQYFDLSLADIWNQQTKIQA